MTGDAELGCRRCGHAYSAHAEVVCDAWVLGDRGRPAGCRCQGFLWVDPAGPAPTYG